MYKCVNQGNMVEIYIWAWKVYFPVFFQLLVMETQFKLVFKREGAGRGGRRL